MKMLAQRNSAGLMVLVAAFVAAGSPALAEGWRLEVRGGKERFAEVPVVIAAPGSLEPRGYVAISQDGREFAPVQVFEDSGKRWAGLVLPGMKAPIGGVYKLKLATNLKDSVVFAPAGPNLAITIAGEPFSVYRIDEGAKPFLFPLIGPTGAPYTRAYPMKKVAGEDNDHPHQRSFWFTHGKVNGVDFWSEMEKHGDIKETARVTSVAGPVLGRLRTTDDWLAPDGKKVCTDERVLTIYRTTRGRVLDFEIEIKATEGPVVFGDTKEGMFGLRVASTMDVNKKLGGKITNAEGLTDDRAWGKASPWVDYCGPVEGKTVGIAILNHPVSFRYPTTWHVRTYGLFAANPFGWHDFGMGRSGEYTLSAGSTLRFAYRVILHDGDTVAANIPGAFESYADPPQITISAQ